MLYLWIKYIHILSSTILFGTGIGTASVMVYGHWTKDIHVMAAINRYVVFVDWIFTGTTGVIQPITGFWMLYIAGFPLTALWIWGSIAGYLLTAGCWFVVVYLQLQIRDITAACAREGTPLPKDYYTYFRWWFFLGCPAFISLLLVFYFMVMKPFSF